MEYVSSTWCCTVRAQHLPATDITTSSGYFLNLSNSGMGENNIHYTALLGRSNELFAIQLSAEPGI